MKRLFLIISILLSSILSGCGVETASAPRAQSFAGGAPVGAPAAPAAPALEAPVPSSNDVLKSAEANGATTGNGVGVDASHANTQRLVVQTAELTIVVKDVKTHVGQIEQLAQTMGGDLVSENIGQTYAPDGTAQPDGQIVIRVPSGQLGFALDQIKKDTVDVQNETRTGVDITNQYVDLQSRLTAKEAAADQLTKIMQNATKTQDVLDVYEQLQQVDSDIEVLKGQIKYDQEAAQLSSITVHVIAEKTIQPIQVGGWTPQGTARDAIQKLVNFWQWFLDVLIKFFLLFLPALITLAIPLFLLFLILRWLFRLVSRRKSKVEAPKQ